MGKSIGFIFWSAPAVVLLLLPAWSGAEALRGITLSTHQSGQDWGASTVPATLDDIQAVGATWISIHPYGFIDADGSIRWHETDPASPPFWLTQPIREAHARGMKVFVKPHLGYWGSPFRWRGEIEFDRAEDWDRFWSHYREWIVLMAEACREADGFAVGTELDRTLRFEDEWRSIIADVRETADFALTYAANWTDYHRVGFWDALDVVGIQAYFPVTEADDPTPEQLVEGWERIMTDIREFSREHGRPVVFTELGYNRSHAAAREPWAYASDGVEAESMQVTCMRVALEAIDREPAVTGVFLWKWFPRPRSAGRNFQLDTPAMTSVIREAWRTTR